MVTDPRSGCSAADIPFDLIVMVQGAAQVGAARRPLP
jgi:hypothetical protein